MISTRTKAAFVGLTALAALAVGVTQAVSGDEAVKAAPQASSCVDGGHLATRMVVDGHTLFIEDTSGRGAVLELAAPCRNVHDLDQIGFEFSGSSQICGRTDVKILHKTSNSSIAARCIIKTYTPLSREEAKAYLANVTRK